VVSLGNTGSHGVDGESEKKDGGGQERGWSTDSEEVDHVKRVSTRRLGLVGMGSVRVRHDQ